MPKPNIIIVLEALYAGIDVEIDTTKFTMQDGKIYQVGTDVNSGEEYLLSTEFLTMNDFITFVNNKLTEEQKISLIGTLALRKMNKKRR